jgi:putative membrane-bound dehydrogenase-like protein
MRSRAIESSRRGALRKLFATLLTLSLAACPSLLAQQVRETPLTPDEELATFRLADPRLTIELVAADPQLDSPVAISWDEDGRLFVAEMIDYPVGPTSGRIRLLEDRDQDGRYEQARVFAEGLNFPNGVLAARGGVFVTAAPDLLFLKDNDGDGRSDVRQVVFTGFGQGNQQLRANGLTYGLDNWIYGANGRSDGEVRRPSDPPERAVSIRARDFRFLPDGSQFQATSGQSQFGQTHDDWGNRFISWNTIPLRHALFDQEFLDRNPRLAEHGVRDIAEPGETGQVFPISPRPQTFNRERTDFYNAMCGLTIYRGDALGSEHAGSAFVGESLSNLVHRRILTPAGPTFVSRRGEHEREFLASTDSWFHPVYLTTGPDGALYVVDFYRRWVEHPQFVPEELRAKVDFRKGSGHGRIWKVSRREATWPPKPTPRMSAETTAEVVRHIESPNGWQRETAQRVLVERRDPLAAPLLRVIVGKNRLSQAKVNALGTLDGLGQLDEPTLQRAMEDADGMVRQFAIRLAGPRLATSPALRTSALKLADFPHPLVRFEVCRALANIDGEQKLAALVKLANLEAADPWIPLAIVGGLGRSSGDFLAQLLATNRDWRRKPSAPQLRLLADVAAASVQSDDAAWRKVLALVAVDKAEAAGPGDLAVLAGLADGLADRGQSLAEMAVHDPGKNRAYSNTIKTLVAAARSIATRDDESLEHRLVAVDVVRRLDPAAGSILTDLVDARHDQALQSAAAAAATTPDPATLAAVFSAWPTRTTATRRALIAAALRSPTATGALVSAIEEGQILAKELDSDTRRALAAVRDPALAARIKPLVDVGVNADRAAVIARYAAALKAPGDRARGAAVFEKHCLTCHYVQGRGHRVGPDLSGIGARAKEVVLVDLLDPSRQVAPDFVAYTLITRDGQVLSGLLASETAAGVTLLRAEGAQDLVLRAQIEELRSSGKSLMPEGMEQNLSEQNVADLLEFLARPEAGLFAPAR